MKFMLMIIDDEAAQSKMSPPEMERMIAAVGSIEKQLEAHKLLLDSRALRPSVEATAVKFQGGQSVAFDGPFVETKEVLGGYFLIECGSKDEAITWAKKFPSTGIAGIEVRPIWEMS